MNLEHMLKEVLVSEGAVCRFMEPMSSHTTFRIGGPAEALYAPAMKKSWGRSSVCAGNMTFPGAYWGMAAISWSATGE